MHLKRLLPFLCVILLLGCAKIKEPEFRRIGSFRVKNFGLQEVTIALNVTYYNPNNFGVSVKEAEADIYLDTVYMGKFLQDSTISVLKNSEFSIPLSGTVSLQKVLKLNLAELAQREVLVKADGSVKVGKAGIFVSKPFQYEGKHRIEDLNFYK
jgi:LEA14-like dessication related protein